MHAVGEDQVQALVAVLVVIELVGDAIDALQLVGVPCSFDYLLRVLVAVRLDSGKLPDAMRKILSKTIAS